MAETEIELTESTLIIHLKGLRIKFLALLGFWGNMRYEIPLASIVDAAKVDQELWEKLGIKQERELKIYVYPSLELEWKNKKHWGRLNYHDEELDQHRKVKMFGIPFTVTRFGYRNVLVLTNNKRNAIAIKLTEEWGTGFFGDPTLVVLPVTDPAGTAAWIKDAVQAYKS